MEQRIAYIDIAKAVAIISVVVGHVLMYDLYGRHYCAQSSLLHVVQSYQIYLFMFLSGMVAVTTIEIKNVLSDIFKRFRSLIVPAIIIGVPYAYWTDANILIYFQNTWKWGYWYLFVLFAMYVICYPIALISHQYSKYTKLTYILIAWLWFLIYRNIYLIPHEINDAFCIGLTAEYFPPFFIGTIVKRHNLYNKVFNTTVFLICLAVIFVKEHLYDFAGFSGRFFSYYIISMNYIIAFAMTIMIIIICKWGGHFLKLNWMASVGKNTLYIYVFHYIALQLMVIPSAHIWFYKNGNIGIDILASMGPAIVSILFSITLKYLLGKIPGLMTLVFYKR